MALVIFVFVVAIVLFAGGGFFVLVVGLGLRRVNRRIVKEGRVTEGRVTGTQTRMKRTAKTRVPQYFATIAFLVEGQSYEQVLQISHQHYQLWAEGTRVHLQYLPSNPKLSLLLDDRTEQQMPLGCFFGAGGFFAAAVAMLVMMILVLLGVLH